MAVYDKELHINGEAVRSPEQQVWKNMQDIKALKEKIKNVYSTDVTTLTSSSVSVATANVDGLGTATEGWLLDPNGLFFKITANDGTTTTLQYYSDLKGPQGDSGAAVSIDDTGTAVDKCWSSNKTNIQINTEVAKAKDKGIYYTKTQPTVVGTNLYYLDFENNILNINTNIPILEKDLLLYIDGDDKVIELYRVTGTNSLTKIGDIGGGKQLYQHNICFGANPWLQIEIINDSPTEIQNYSDIVNYIKDKGFTHSGSASLASGTITKWHKLSGTSGTANYIGIYYNTNSNNLVALQTSNYLEINYIPTIDSDTVIPL